MTCRPDRPLRTAIAALVLAMAPALSGCGEEATPGDPVDEARLALQRGDGIGAEVLLRQSLEQGRPRESIAALLGEAELLQGNLPEAREWLEAGAFDDATRAHGFHTLGRLEIRSGNLAAAGAAFDKAWVENPDNPELWVDIGRLRYRGGEQLQALEAAERAVELGPRNPEALHFRGQLVRDAHGLAAALPWFEAALAQAPDDPALLSDYAATLGELGRAREMLEAIRRLARVEPGNPQIHYLQAVVAARAGNFALARSLLLRSGNLEREIPAAMLLSAVIDLENGNYGSAAQALVRLAERQPENRRVEALLARALLLGRSEGELVYRFDDLGRRLSASPYLATLVGRAYEALDDREAAAGFLDRAAQPRTASLIALQGSGDRRASRSDSEVSGDDTRSSIRDAIVEGRAVQAARQAEAFKARFAGSADAMSLAGDAQLAARNPRLAIERYEESAEIRRPWPLTRRLIMAYRTRGRDEDAVRLLAAQVVGDPSNAEAAGLLAVTYADLGKWAEAAALLDHALALGGSRDPRLLALRARAAATLGQGEEALRFARRAHAIQPDNPLAANMLAAAKERSGVDGGAAEMLLAKARALSRTGTL